MTVSSFSYSVRIEKASAGKSTLQIPDLEMGFFRSRCVYHGGRAGYFSFMATNFLPFLGFFKKKIDALYDPNWNTIYQNQGQDLQRMHFIPHGGDWELFRQAAQACGVSICFLFVFLMTLEATGFFEHLMKKTSVGRNSSPQMSRTRKKLKKFSKIERQLDLGQQILHRNIRMR